MILVDNQELMDFMEQHGGVRQKYSPRTKISNLEEKIIILLKGVVHLEDGKEKEPFILTYLNDNYLLDLQILAGEHSKEIFFSSDTEIEVIEMNRSRFFELIKQKASLLEWIVVSNSRIVSKIYAESSKFYVNSTLKIIRSFRSLIEENILLPNEQQDGWYKMLPFMTRRNLASYCQLSRKTLGQEIKLLEEEGLLIWDSKGMFVNAEQLERGDSII
ncbi:hypothetical protein HCA78_00210 [Listeria booriae]|uniref:Cyclic nucleotide-binding domain-containing protein n=1 Tax=Listeria booriae TaxID=1552123 RepID=A0A842CJY0_9LIST|nr:hypothetical protein [Listeria booriae]MBC2002168.1 hypothetical protein [Listeria booriae]